MFEERKSRFKKGLDTEARKVKKEQAQIELRKSKKQEDMQSKRTQQPDTNSRDSTWFDVQVEFQKNYSLADLPQLHTLATSTDPKCLLEAAYGIRKILAKSKQLPGQQVIDSGLIPFLLAGIQNSGFPQLQYECCWSLANITSGPHLHCKALVEKGILGFMPDVLNSTSELVRNQAFWCVANLACDSHEYRDHFLAIGIVPLLVQALKKTQEEKSIYNGIWALSNMSRGKPEVNPELMAPAVEFLVDCAVHINGEEPLTNVLWALFHCVTPKAKVMMEYEFVHRLLELVSHSEGKIVSPALKIVAQLIYVGSARPFVSDGVLAKLSSLLYHARVNIRVDTVWALSNIAAEHPDFCQELNKGGFGQKIFYIMQNDQNKIKEECIWFLSNLVTNSDVESQTRLVGEGIFNAYAQGLTTLTPTSIRLILSSVQKLLETGQELLSSEGINQFAVKFEESGGLPILEDLQTHANVKIYKSAYHIITYFFSPEVGEDDLLNDIQAIANEQFQGMLLI